MSERLYPLRLEPLLRVMVWGGRRLASRLNKPLPPDQPVGESWEVFWKNKVANGAYAGQTLGDVIAANPLAMIGQRTADAEFPLLVKFLDPQQWLSVQVHPDDAKAMQLEGQPRGKTECWYVIDAAPGAQIVYGFEKALDAQGLRAAIESGKTRDVLQVVDVRTGDFIYMPAGMMHALGPGCLIYELQQTSDTTYRVYDWDRVGLDGKPRELHIDKAIACTQLTVKPPAQVPYTTQPSGTHDLSALVRGPYFGLDKLAVYREVAGDTQQTPGRDGLGMQAHLLSVVGGQLRLEFNTYEVDTLDTGDSVFLPAGLGAYRLLGTGEVLRAWVWA